MKNMHITTHQKPHLESPKLCHGMAQQRDHLGCKWGIRLFVVFDWPEVLTIQCHQRGNGVAPAITIARVGFKESPSREWCFPIPGRENFQHPSVAGHTMRCKGSFNYCSCSCWARVARCFCCCWHYFSFLRKAAGFWPTRRRKPCLGVGQNAKGQRAAQIGKANRKKVARAFVGVFTTGVV